MPVALVQILVPRYRVRLVHGLGYTAIDRRVKKYLMLKLLLLSISIVASTVSVAGSYTPEQVRSAVKQAGGAERFIAEMAINSAKMSGQMLDDQTQLTGSVSRQRTVVYYLRMVNYEKKDIKDIDAFGRKVASMLAPSVCTAPIASILINEYGAEYKYMAYSRSRAYLFEYGFNRTTCAPSYRW